jgi:hypothetical protein
MQDISTSKTSSPENHRVQAWNAWSCFHLTQFALVGMRSFAWQSAEEAEAKMFSGLDCFLFGSLSVVA